MFDRDKNEPWGNFLKALEARKIITRFAWTADRGHGNKGDVAFLLFTGEGFKPHVLTAIAIDYGHGDGFGLYLDSPRGEIEAEAEFIATGRETKGPETFAEAEAAVLATFTPEQKALFEANLKALTNETATQLHALVLTLMKGLREIENKSQIGSGIEHSAQNYHVVAEACLAKLGLKGPE